MACSEMTASALSTEQVPLSLPPGSPVMSRIDCVSLCVLSVYCTTMFYNKDTKSCILTEDFNHRHLIANSDPIQHLKLGKAPCPIQSGYLYNWRLNMCYKKHADRKKWPEAKTACSEVGSYLVVINSAERNQFMYEIAADIGPFWASGNIFGSSWTWGDNSSVSEPTFWSPGEPDKNSSTQKCLVFFALDLPNSWHAGDCFNHSFAYVCEIAV